MSVVRIARRTGILLAAVMVLLAPAAAHADGELALSPDGVHWQDSLDTPLFDGRLRWVPGDVRTASFHVRNNSTDAGDLDVALDRSGSDALLDSSYLTVSGRTGDGAWSSVDRAGLRSLVDDADIASGADVRVDVRVALSENAPNGTMVLGTDLDFRVTLTDAAVGPDGGGPDGGGPDGGGPDSNGGLLPDTGSVITLWLPVVALVLVGTGVVLIARRRRSDDDDDSLEATLNFAPSSP